MRKPRVVVAGQIPPPFGGQNIMIAKAVAQFAASPDCESIHLPFFFTADFQQVRKVGLRKIFELLRVIVRLLRIRCAGPIDLLLYPTGGPQTVPIVRDLILLPWMLLCTRKVILHFHAAGVADRCAGQREHLLCRLLSVIYGRVSGALVMTAFNRRDPEFFGIKKIAVRPHRIQDECDQLVAAEECKSANPECSRLLYVGHLHPNKGTDELLRAFSDLRSSHPNLTLELVGECLPPWRISDVKGLLHELGLASHVTLPGVLTGRAKAAAFAQADLFVFPTVAPYESFGIVLIEAMMWGLPIVATRWRGNEDVLTPLLGGVLFAVSRPLAQGIRDALELALAQNNLWRSWGKINRSIFEKHYQENLGDLWLVETVLSEFYE